MLAAVLITFGTPASIAARTAGMLYECASASRTVTRPWKRLS
jgi:hypothetical protein